MTEPKLLTADELDGIEYQVIVKSDGASPFAVARLLSHIAALQARVDAAEEALRVVAAIETLHTRKQVITLMVNPSGPPDEPEFIVEAAGRYSSWRGQRHGGDTLLAALEQAVASKESTNAQ